MKKKTKKKLISLMVKTLLILGGVLMVLAFVIHYKNGEKLYDEITIFLGIGIVFLSLFLAYKFPYALERVKVKAYEIPLDILNFDDFIKYLDENISVIGYDKFPYLSNNRELSCVYYKKIFDVLEYYSVYHFDEIKESKTKTLNYCDILMEDFFNSYYQGKKKNDFYRDTCIIWVDKETKYFEDIINTNLSQGEYDGLLIIGISPSNKTIYVANQKDGNNKILYWKLRRKFLKVMHLKMKDKIKR